MIDSVFKIIQGIVRLRGATDNTLIGNISDRLKVDATTQPGSEIGTNQYSFGSLINAASAGIKNPIFLIRNPSGSGKVLFLKRIRVGVSVTNVSCDFYLHSNPTVTNFGTVVNSYECNVGFGQAASVAVVTSNPTISNFGNQLYTTSIGQNTSGDSIGTDYVYAIRPGNSLLISADPSSNNRLMSYSVIWKDI